MTKILMALALLVAAPAFAVETTLTVQSVAETAATLTLASADTSNGNRYRNDQEDVLVVLQNTDGSNSATVTFDAVVTSIDDSVLGTITKTDQAVSLAAGAIKVLGPLPRKIFNTSSEYVNMAITGSGASSVKIGVMKSPKLIRMR